MNEQDAAVRLALGQLRHAYQQAFDFHIGDQRTYAEHLLGPVIKTLERALAERPTCDWQPIATAPKDGRDVLLTDGKWKRTGYWARRVETWSVDTAAPLPPATHWMPLPARVPLSTPLPSCSICRRDDCGGDHPCE